VKITIPDYKLPSRNQLYSSNNWYARKALVDELKSIVGAYVPNKMIDDRVDITIKAYYKTKLLRDSDNIEAKLVIDCLKGKVIHDDNVKYVRRVTTEAIIGSITNKLVIEISTI
jgi:hypothetical protein